MGDMPSLVATTKKAQGDIRLVAANMISLGQNCNYLVVRKDAPDFQTPQEALQWLNGKGVAAHRGTCSNRFVDSVLDKTGVKPKERLNMTIEVIASSFEAGKLDAAPMWQPHAQKVVDQGHGKYIATGAPWGEWDANFTIMRQDFIQKHPEAAKGWVKAEIEALQIMQNEPEAVAQMVLKETQGYSEKTMWKALYQDLPANIGGEQVKYIGEMAFTPRVLDIMRAGYEFLHKLKVTDSSEMPKDAINEGPVKAALAEMGMSVPVVEIKALPLSAYSGK
jgi:NitT/TauT family transport system substrate-binding protein